LVTLEDTRGSTPLTPSRLTPSVRSVRLLVKLTADAADGARSRWSECRESTPYRFARGVALKLVSLPKVALRQEDDELLDRSGDRRLPGDPMLGDLSVVRAIPVCGAASESAGEIVSLGSASLCGRWYNNSVPSSRPSAMTSGCEARPKSRTLTVFPWSWVETLSEVDWQLTCNAVVLTRQPDPGGKDKPTISDSSMGPRCIARRCSGRCQGMRRRWCVRWC
jgi:hypothetical protein